MCHIRCSSPKVLLRSVSECFPRKMGTDFSLSMICCFTGTFRLLDKGFFRKNDVIKIFICFLENSNFFVLGVKIFQKGDRLHFPFWLYAFERAVFVKAGDLFFFLHLHLLKFFIHERISHLKRLFNFFLFVLLQHGGRRNMNGKVIINSRLCLMFH